MMIFSYIHFMVFKGYDTFGTLYVWFYRTGILIIYFIKTN